MILLTAVLFSSSLTLPAVLTKDEYTIGRHAQSDFVFCAITMSNTHCRIFKVRARACVWVGGWA